MSEKASNRLIFEIIFDEFSVDIRKLDHSLKEVVRDIIDVTKPD